MPITPVILSGGAGTRLWPLSRPERPKQFLALTGPETMLAMTAGRVADRSRFAAPLVVASAAHRAEIAAQLAAVGADDATLILEPAGRNTAPAIALAALAAAPDALLLVMPSDHLITDAAAFHAAVDAGVAAARDGWLLTFGMTPTHPETGFGYIEQGPELAPGVRRTRRFVEKPDLATAQAYLAAGTFLWNGGIFLFRADAMIAALALHAPRVLDAARDAMAGAARDGQAILPDTGAFGASPSISIDNAVMGGSDRVAVVPTAMGWSDVGSWDALYDVSPKDERGNSLGGDVHAIDAANLLVRAEGVRVTCVGVHDLLVIADGDHILVMPRGSSQRVREAVDALKAGKEKP
ncbi:MAG: Mannose-1-phosphate guanylyltransferase / Mannose-6-phosphate isomerase [uncultured Sphingomonadaceae bacterium]|uniref:mannose-1-phosphate guanylyltransferase n=1 Tax=uncultured Sphingomonadaceae bacterium TaxID=169976 RepID=A0A6J4SVV6_9SPHN|nr:MAG: Mannose-1-phosphate guanylyltransferase / Mannose-6-phosphate isomerase [uncultured Sphingomonadaceae bacterium]